MFEGAYTAIVTPFTTDGDIDFDCYRMLLERQIENGVDGVLPVGTTGESPTLNMQEHEEVIAAAVDVCRGRIKVMAGTGGNSTAEALELTRHAMDAGADGTLQVTPYYNKPSQEGLYRHFSTVADLGLPVVLYNVPGRTSRAIDIDTIERLSHHEHIVAVKEAGGSVERVSQILDACEIEVLSGDDSLTFPMMAVGATGVISVATNVIPKPVSEMVHHVLEGRWDEAAKLHRALYPLFRDLFLDTNPVPVKAALAMMGLIEETYRLPLCAMPDDLKAKLAVTMRKMKLIS